MTLILNISAMAHCSRLWGVPLDAALIFNCQMGRGRTTTGMIIASLLHLRRIEAFPIKAKKADTRGE